MIRVTFGLLGLVSALATTAPATLSQVSGRAQGSNLAQVSNAPGDSRWLPWIGCWEGATEVGSVGAERVLVCFEPGAASDAVEILTYESGSVIAREDLRPNGLPSPVEEEGCAGQRSATWSEDGNRVFLFSDLNCGGTLGRSTRGVLAVLPSGRGWIEIQSARSGSGNPVLGIRTFVRATRESLAEAGIPDPSAGLDLAIVTARARAGETLTGDALVEIVEQSGPDVAGSLLVERGQPFGLTADLLRSLSERGVPGEVLDVMVAVSYPDRFQLGGAGEIDPEARPTAALSQNAASGNANRAVAPWPDYDRGRAYQGYSPWRLGYFDPYWADPFYYDPYFYGNRYGYGYGSGPYGYRPFGSPYYEYPRVIIVAPPTVEDRNDVYLDPDRGLVRRDGGSSGNVTPAPSSRGSSGSTESRGQSTPAASSSGRSGSTSSDSDDDDDNSSGTVRRAVPRSGGGGNR